VSFAVDADVVRVALFLCSNIFTGNVAVFSTLSLQNPIGCTSPATRIQSIEVEVVEDRRSGSYSTTTSTSISTSSLVLVLSSWWSPCSRDLV